LSPENTIDDGVILESKQQAVKGNKTLILHLMKGNFQISLCKDETKLKREDLNAKQLNMIKLESF